MRYNPQESEACPTFPQHRVAEKQIVARLTPGYRRAHSRGLPKIILCFLILRQVVELPNSVEALASRDVGVSHALETIIPAQWCGSRLPVGADRIRRFEQVADAGWTAKGHRDAIRERANIFHAQPCLEAQE